MNAAGGRHHLHTPGPTNVPERILRAMAAPTIDHRGPEFATLTTTVIHGLQGIFDTSGPVVIYPSSGTGAWEAALVNTLSPGDTVLAFETGHFATLWRNLATRLGLRVQFVPGDWRHGVDPDHLAELLRADPGHEIAAVMVVHNETSTGVASRIPAIRAAMDAAEHPALLLVDTVSSLASMEYHHDAWGADVTVSCSQKGLMLPPGLGLNAISAKALEAAQGARLPRGYWNWAAVLEANRDGRFPYTPATNLLFGLREALAMLSEEGLPAVFARHRRHAEATRAAVRTWGLEMVAADEREYSSSLTAIFVPPPHDADKVAQHILERYDLALGIGLGKLAGRVLRIGHLGHLGDLDLAAALAGVQLGLTSAGIAVDPHGIGAALGKL